jgi:hypothetical protein
MTSKNSKGKMPVPIQHEMIKKVIKIATPVENKELSTVALYKHKCSCTNEQKQFRKSYQVLAKNIEKLQIEYDILRKKEEPPPIPKLVARKTVFKPSVELIRLRDKLQIRRERFEENKINIKLESGKRAPLKGKNGPRYAPSTEASKVLPEMVTFQLAEKVKKSEKEYEDLLEQEKMDFEKFGEALTKVLPKIEVKPVDIYVPSTALTTLKNRIELLKLQLAPKKKIMSQSPCTCWVEEEYSIWEEEELLWNEEVQHYYHTSKEKMYFLSNRGKGYFTYKETGEKDYKNLGFDSFYRSPLYEKLYLCPWHGSLIQSQKIELLRKIGSGVLSNPALSYADPHYKIPRIITEGDEKGEVEQDIRVAGDPPIYGVYVYLSAGVDVDVVCYDNCEAISRDKIKKEDGNDEEKVAELRDFNRNLEPTYNEVLSNFKVFNTYVESLNKNGIRLKELLKKTTSVEQGTLEKEVRVALLVKDKVEEEYKQCQKEAENAWARKVAKVKEQNLAKEKYNIASGRSISLSFEELLKELSKLPFPPDDTPDIEKMLYNATMIYLDYMQDVEEGSEILDIIEQDRLRLDILNLDTFISKQKLAQIPLKFSEILILESTDDNNTAAEKQLNKLILQYEDEKNEEVLANLRTKIMTLKAEIEEELAEDRDFQEELERPFVNENENDISEAAHLRYIATVCQEKKSLLNKGEKDYNLKKIKFDSDTNSLIANKEELKGCILMQKQGNNDMDKAITRPHFLGTWFVERAEKFSSYSSLKGLPIDDEKVAAEEKLEEENYRLMVEKTNLDKVIIAIKEKCIKIKKKLIKTEKLLTSRAVIWRPEYEEYKSNQTRGKIRNVPVEKEPTNVIVKRRAATLNTLVKPESKSTGPKRIQPVFSGKAASPTIKPPLVPRPQISVALRPISPVAPTEVIVPQSITVGPTKMQKEYKLKIMRDRAANIPSIHMIEKKMSPVIKSPTLLMPIIIPKSGTIIHNIGSPVKASTSPVRINTSLMKLNTSPTTSFSSTKAILKLNGPLVPKAPSPPPEMSPPTPIYNMKKRVRRPLLYTGPKFTEPLKPPPATEGTKILVSLPPIKAVRSSLPQSENSSVSIRIPGTN